MDTRVDERDYKLLEADRYTFFVLKRIMGGECNLLLTDHERMIICFTGHPFPVWIWTADDASEDGSELKITTNMFAYDCLDPVRPKTEADGEIYGYEMKDLEEVVYFLDIFHKELSIDQKDISGYREDAEAFINTGNMYQKD